MFITHVCQSGEIAARHQSTRFGMHHMRAPQHVWCRHVKIGSINTNDTRKFIFLEVVKVSAHLSCFVGDGQRAPEPV